MTLINKAVLEQCVGRDGGASTDQFLTDPRDCHFDPKVLLCTGGKLPPACLTADQVTTMQKYYAGTIDPVNGQVINPGSERGNETDDVLALGLAFQERLPEPAFDGLFYWVFGPSFGYPASAVNFANFDFHHDVDTVDDQLAAVLNANSTDLGEFREHGGKLIMYHGWADPLIPSQSSINYFNALVGNDSHGFQQASFSGGQPGAAADPELRPAVHGARDVPLLRRARPQHVRCAHTARHLGRDRRGAGDDRRHQVRQRYAARGSDDPAALRLPQGREVHGERQHQHRGEFHLRRRRARLQPDAGPQIRAVNECDAGEPRARRRVAFPCDASARYLISPASLGSVRLIWGMQMISKSPANRASMYGT